MEKKTALEEGMGHLEDKDEPSRRKSSSFGGHD